MLKVAAPYFAWSAIYLAASQPDSALTVVKALLTGGASAQMYYLLVYAQLVALTPLLFRLLRSHRALLYVVTPCMLAAWELLAFLDVDAPRMGILFPTWLIYYLFGLEWERWCELLRSRLHLVAFVAVAALLAQVVEGFLWDTYGDYSMATTQLRLTNMMSSLAIISLFMLSSDSLRSRLSSSGMLVRLGDLSFGVYLCHMAFLMVLRKLLAVVGLTGFLPSLVLWLLVLASSAFAVAICRRILPRRMAAALGFV